MARLEHHRWYGDEPEGCEYRALDTLLWGGAEYHAGDVIPPHPINGNFFLAGNGKLWERIGPGVQREAQAPADRESLVARGLAQRFQA